MDENPTARSALAAWGSMVDVACIDVLPRATNPLWRVGAANGQTFVLKLLPEFPPGVSPVEEFRVLSHLQECGVPVAVPILTDDAAIHTTVGNRLYALLPFLPSEPGNHESGPDAAETAFTIGGAIGQMNRALAACPWQLHSFVDDPGRQILVEALSGLPEEATRPILPFTDRLRDAIRDLPTQLTHGDCNDGNVLVRDRRVSGFIDFDHLPVGPRVRDLSYYLASRVRTHLAQPETASRDTRAMLAVLDHYVAGYHLAHPLTRPELGAIVPLMLLVEVGGAHWCLNGWEPDLEGYRQSLRSIDWISAHIDELTAAAEIGHRGARPSA